MIASNNYDPPIGGRGDNNYDRHDPWQIKPIPPDLIEQPLDFIYAEHHRQREVAGILLLIAEGEFDHDGVKRLVDFLENDFAQHINDEEIVLFPVLRQLCLPEDNIDAIIERLQEEHQGDESIGDEVIEVLKMRLESESLDNKAIRKIRLLAEHIRQHLALENSVLLPIARVRLAESDLKILGDMLKDRRVARKATDS